MITCFCTQYHWPQVYRVYIFALIDVIAQFLCKYRRRDDIGYMLNYVCSITFLIRYFSALCATSKERGGGLKGGGVM